MVAIDLPRETSFGVKEIKMFLYIKMLVNITIHFIVLPQDIIVNMTILQISICRQTVKESIAGFSIDITVILGGIIEVIVSVWVSIAPTLLYPKYTSEVVAIITVESSA